MITYRLQNARIEATGLSLSCRRLQRLDRELARRTVDRVLHVSRRPPRRAESEIGADVVEINVIDDFLGDRLDEQLARRDEYIVKRLASLLQDLADGSFVSFVLDDHVDPFDQRIAEAAASRDGTCVEAGCLHKNNSMRLTKMRLLMIDSEILRPRNLLIRLL